MPFSRFALASAAVLWMAFGYLDVLVASDTLSELWTIRFAIGLPTIVLGLAASYIPAVKPKYHLVLMTAATICGSCIIAMVTVNSPPASDYYCAGIIIVLIFTYTFIQLPFVHATLAGLVCLLAYEYVAIFVKQSPFDVIVNNTYFLVATNYVGVFACYTLERYRRRNFLQLRIIEEESTKLAELTEQPEDLSVHDPLTGLLNRRQLAAHLESALQAYRRHNTPTSVMLIDLDDFKEINDRYGHLAGDELLRRTSRVITSTIRKTDLAFRYGGDEFLVLLPDTTLKEAQDLAGRLIDRCQRFGRGSGHFDEAAGISVGVAAIDDETLRPDDLLQAAYRALYAAKQRGKGCVVVAGATP